MSYDGLIMFYLFVAFPFKHQVNLWFFYCNDKCFVELKNFNLSKLKKGVLFQLNVFVVVGFIITFELNLHYIDTNANDKFGRFKFKLKSKTKVKLKIKLRKSW